jgi:tRNA pseudouridine55 synthase
MSLHAAKHGVLLIDKAAGMTSRAVDNAVKRALGRGASVGHAGTLDPFATGLLPVMVGEATKLSHWLTGGTKVYEAVLRLGVKTSTADCEGEVIEEAPVPQVTAEIIDAAMEALTGEIEQIPPKFSAIKQGGRPLYALAREGVAVEVPVRRIKVDGWRLDHVALPEIGFTVTCGSGTYVRTLGEQLADALGTVGHLRALRRLQAGALHVADAASLEEALANWPLLPIGKATNLPAIAVAPDVVAALRQGRQVSLPPDGSLLEGETQEAIATTPEGEPVAIVQRTALDTWKVLRGFRFSA